jgi:hypothetical protein
MGGRACVLVLLAALISSCVTPSYARWGTEAAGVGFSLEAHAAARTLWVGQTVEWAACLEAEETAGIYYVTKVVVAPQTGNDSLGIPYYDCKGYPGRLHTHLVMGGYFRHQKMCQRSYPDLKSFWQRRYRFEVIWCGEDSYRWYTRNGEQGGVNDR